MSIGELVLQCMKFQTLFRLSFQIPEYCRAMEEQEILDHAFELIFAFDEIVALGYRESVNLAQIRTFTEMDSHEEKMYEAVREVRGTKRHSILRWFLCRTSSKMCNHNLYTLCAFQYFNSSYKRKL